MEMNWNQIKSGGNGEGTPFLKLQSGENRVRVVSLPYEVDIHWEKATDGSNKRVVCLGHGCPVCKAGHVPQKRYQSLVIDRTDGKIKILEGGNSIFSQIKQYAVDADYGDPSLYDIKIIKSGSGRETKYSVMATPNKSQLTQQEQSDLDSATKLSDINKPKTLEEIMAMNLEVLDDDNNWENLDNAGNNSNSGDKGNPPNSDDDWNAL